MFMEESFTVFITQTAVGHLLGHFFFTHQQDCTFNSISTLAIPLLCIIRPVALNRESD